MIHDLRLDGFKVRASIDFIQFASLLHPAHLKEHLTGRVETPGKPGDDSHYVVTLHDPTPDDIRFLRDKFVDPPLRGLELSIDFFAPGPAPNEQWAQLESCYLALAARLRVDDRHPTGAGFKAAYAGPHRMTPLNVRLALVNETLYIGHRDTGANFKLYLKTKDRSELLPAAEQRVRMEITIGQSCLGLFGFKRIGSMFGYRYRGAFAKHFQVVERVTVRDRADWPAEMKSRAERALNKRWPKVGVHAIGPARMPADALAATREAAARREVRGPHAVLPARHYRFHRHQRAHALIANALQQLERRHAR